MSSLMSANGKPLGDLTISAIKEQYLAELNEYSWKSFILLKEVDGEVIHISVAQAILQKIKAFFFGCVGAIDYTKTSKVQNHILDALYKGGNQQWIGTERINHLAISAGIPKEQIITLHKVFNVCKNNVLLFQAINWNHADAFKNLVKSAKEGDLAARTNLAHLYEKGLVVDEGINGFTQIDSRIEAIKWYKAALTQGCWDPNAIHHLAEMYKMGKINDAEAIQFFKSKEDERSDSEFFIQLAEILAHYYGNEEIPGYVGAMASKEAKYWLLQAYVQKYNAVIKDFKIGAPQENDEMLLKVLQEGAEWDITVAIGNLGLFYMDHRVPSVNPNDADREAVKFLQIAAKRYNITAMYNLANLYEKGLSSIDKKITHGQAVYWYEKAAQKNDLESMYRLGLILMDPESGLDPIQSKRKAIEWLKLAASLGDIRAMVSLGVMNRLDRKNGNRSPISDEEALMYFQYASKKGDLYASINLAIIYARREVEIDENEAKNFINGVADRCIQEAKLTMSLLPQNSSPDEVAKAKVDLEKAEQLKIAIDNGTFAKRYFLSTSN